MRKVVLTCVLFLFAWNALAVPAKPGVFTRRQPDGSTVRLELHGDEFFSWTTLAGTRQVVAKDAQGFWRPATLDLSARDAARERRRSLQAQRQDWQPRTHTDNPVTHGTRHIPVLLVAFQDVDFTLDHPQDRFNALLNQNGYAANGATGSVQDYFLDNSKGHYQPVFDVYGPVVLPKDMAYYGAHKGKSHDIRPEIALYHAAQLLDSSMDFSQYDHDGDGIVDMTLFYFAGYNEAEYGPEDSIWPHQWSLQYSSDASARSARFDGVKLGNYFCTSELRGDEGAEMCGIGTTCHEFSHSLGLPDFYDTDYEENGECEAMSVFSLMASGAYVNEGRTPPYLNSEERILLGWMTEDDIQELPEGELTLTSVQDDVVYRSFTTTDGEYFVYECRDGSGWDAFLPQGLIVYHADKSTVRTVGGLTPYKQWEYWDSYNSINAYGDHPCFYVIPAADPDNLNYPFSWDNLASWMFPGSGNVTNYVPIDWEGNSTGLVLSHIQFSAGKVSLSAHYSTEKSLVGRVVGSSGKGVEGVSLVLTAQEPAASPHRRVIRPRTAFACTTDASGFFSMSLEGFDGDKGHLTLSKEGYQTLGVDVTLGKHTTNLQLTIRTVEEGNLYFYSYYDPDGELYVYGDEESTSQMGAIRIPAASVPEDGGVLTSVSLWREWPAKAYYIIVDAGDERLYTLPVTLGDYVFQTLDLSEYELVVPGGKDLYIGYGLEEADTSEYPDCYGCLLTITETGENLYWGALDLHQSNWTKDQYGYALVFDATIAAVEEDDEPITSFAQLGIPAIADPGRGVYAAGDVFLLEMELPEGVSAQPSWAFDGLPVTDPVTLQAGRHTVTAVLQYADGSVETLDLIIDVK